MRRPLVAVFAVLLLSVTAERVIDDTDENSEDIFEPPHRLESIDDTPPDEFGVSPFPGEIQFHRRGHASFGSAEDADEADENQGSDGFPRLTAMVDEPSITTNETAQHLLPLPNGNDDRPLDGIRTDTRTGAKKVVEPFPTLLANAGSDGEKETIIELTMAPNTSMTGFGSALAEGERAPVMEYDIEESAGKSDEEETPVEKNLTAAVIFQSKDNESTTSSAPTTLTTTAATTVTPHASHFPTRDRAGIFPSESTEQLTANGRPPTEHPAPVHSTTKTADSMETTDPPFAMVDPTIFNPDNLFAVPAAPGIQETPEEAKEEIEEEDSELKKALSSEAHLATSTIESIMTSIASTRAPTTEERVTVTSTTAIPTTTSSIVDETMTRSTTAAPLELPTTTHFQLPPLIVTSHSTVASSTTESSTTFTSTHPTTPFVSTSNFPEEPVQMHEGHRETTASAEEVHFEDRPFETTEQMPFDPTAAHFGDSQEELWRSTHGQNEMMGAVTTTTEPLIAHKTPFHIMVKDVDYMPDFSDPDSGKFRKLKDQLLPDLRRHFEKSINDFIAVDLSSVEKERGVVVHGLVYTRNSIVDLYETANKFEAELELNQMRLGGNEIESGTFTLNGINARAPVERVQQASASADGSIAFIIAGIITTGVIVILIVVFVIILINNHRRGVGSIKLKEDAEAEAGRRAQIHYGNVNLMSYNSPPPPQPPSTQLLQTLPHVIINTKSGSRPSSTMTSPTTPRANMMH
ncbi:hypothetical protein PENTCL1PPCAC_21603 [Pristionchus entomophagus]|uniref:SEA domain-containing protein n=1 Tax=Pristionchus entomophagus TaxID=358040 RepID=A0AAV5TYY0_9BILA|nr:hypothetical protein PENTCL1PPCAC_21603 [Pristionchus entomophagus]